MTLLEFNQAIGKLFRIKLDKDTSHYQYYIYDNIKFRLKKNRYKEICANLDTMTTIEGYELSNNQHYEVSLSFGSRVHYWGGKEEIKKDDNVNGVKYRLGQPSDEYLVFFIQSLYELSKSEGSIRPVMFYRLRNRAYNNQSDICELLDILKELIPRFQTLQIISSQDKTLKEFENNSYSFLFTLGFNTDLAFLPTNITEDFFRAVRIGRIRRARIDDIEAPKRKYLQDLILFYQKAISSESADLQFLSFYHIIEHFFEKVYNDDILKTLQNTITAPSFSYKRAKDLNVLIKVIQEKLKYRNEEFQINEPEALRLVLERFIPDFEDIKNEIEGYDKTLIDYYKQNEVSFSRGNRVNFNEDKQTVVKNLRERVYKTRNSIVHSKETDKMKYLPFKHDKELLKEIILMRVIAEKIIIGSSEEL